MRKNEGLTLVEVLVTIALIAIVAAISVPVFTNITSQAEQDASVVDTDSKQRFYDQWDRAGYFVVDGTGENAGYTVAIWDKNNDGVQQENETQVVAKIKK